MKGASRWDEIAETLKYLKYFCKSKWLRALYPVLIDKSTINGTFSRWSMKRDVSIHRSLDPPDLYTSSKPSPYAWLDSGVGDTDTQLTISRRPSCLKDLAKASIIAGIILSFMSLGSLERIAVETSALAITIFGVLHLTMPRGKWVTISFRLVACEL